MPLSHTSTPVPKHFFFVLYHGHQLLDSAGPLDILRTMTMSPEGRDFTLTYLADSLEPINQAPLPPRGATWEFEAIPELSHINKGFNVRLVPDMTFDDALKQLRETGAVTVDGQQRTLDVLFIPGGVGSRMTRVENGQKTLNVQPCVDFTKAVCEEGLVKSAVMTVCTGSDILGRTGLLDGRRATTNHRAFPTVSGRHQQVDWLARRRWVRSIPDEKTSFDKEIWTSAGISAGMDLTLWFAAEIYGKEFARGIAGRLEYEWREHVGEGEIDEYYNEQ